ncbi:unnamed protein product [Allacma fusca]|uniref:Uncharacterized protein n=1 Tax=Allacma fusca TaxID=39272 RepID=A0A8J2JU71_9HEXA|nr:unnamed protein product [Allacma fusca]
MWKRRFPSRLRNRNRRRTVPNNKLSTLIVKAITTGINKQRTKWSSIGMRFTPATVARCNKCNEKHHFLIHYDEKPSTSEATSVTSAVSSPVAHEDEKQVLLSTAVVKARDANGGHRVLSDMLDSLQVSIIPSCLQSLGLRRKRATINQSGISNCNAGTSRERV